MLNASSLLATGGKAREARYSQCTIMRWCAGRKLLDFRLKVSHIANSDYFFALEIFMRTLPRTVKCLFVSGLSIISTAASAQWTLNNEASTLSFVTVKADHVAEVHTFDELSGAIDADGLVSIEIELASVNTLVPIRNERMQSMLFETNLFPRGSIKAQINAEQLANIAVGSSEEMGVDFSLELHEQSQNYNATVLVSRQQSGLVATTLKPIVVSAESFDLVSGVESLREVAGLPSISRAVPVSFTVVFEDRI